MKTRLNLSIDVALLEEARAKGINLSNVMEETLKDLLLIKGQDLGTIHEAQLRAKLQAKTREFQSIKREAQSYEDTLKLIDAKKSKEKQEQAQAEKKRIETAKKCLNCGVVTGEEMQTHKFKAGLVCHGCFMGCSSKDLKKWDQ